MKIRYEISAYRKENRAASRTVWRNTESEVKEWVADIEMDYPNVYDIEVTILTKVEGYGCLNGKQAGEWVQV